MNMTQTGALFGLVLIGAQLFRHKDSKSPILTAVDEVIGMGKPRGIRNNNPTNIKYNSANRWEGQTGNDGVFATFSTPELGIRAATKLLQSYQHRYDLKTTRQIISRWAPAGEENPHQESYIQHVAKELGLSPDETVLSSQYPVMLAAMIQFENGVQPYSMDLIAHGVSLA